MTSGPRTVGTVTATATADSKCGGASQTEGGQCPDWPRQLGSVMFCLRPVEDINPFSWASAGEFPSRLIISPFGVVTSSTASLSIKSSSFR